MNAHDPENLDWAVRSFVYAFVVDRARTPTVAAAAAGPGIATDRVRSGNRALDRDPYPTGASTER